MMVKGKPAVASPAGTVRVTVTSIPELLGVTDDGLNKHAAPGGRPAQLRFTD